MSNDFFNNFEGKPPVLSQRRAPPPPPPKPNGSATATPPVLQTRNDSSRQTAPSFRSRAPHPAPTGSRTTGLNSSTPASRSSVGAPPPSFATNTSTVRSTRPVKSSRPTSSYYGNSAAGQGPPAAVHHQPSGTAAPLSTPTQVPAFYGDPAPAADPGDWFTASVEHSDVAYQQQPQQSSAQFQPQQQQAYASSMMESSSSLEGMMDTSDRSNANVFIPRAAASSDNLGASGQQGYFAGDFENEPPLLEELGINVEHILLKTKAVVLPSQRFNKNTALTDPALIVEDADLAGPLALALTLGGEMLLAGKLQFGYIYGFGLFGCMAMTLILNLMSPKAVSFWTVTSILGYALLPVNILALVKIVLVNIIQLNTLARILAVLTILWSTTASTRLLEVGCNMRNQRYLMAYPIALLYSAFVLITIF